LESLLGISEDAAARAGTVEKAIVQLKLDKLERLLVNDHDKTAAYWAIAGMLYAAVVLCRHFSQKARSSAISIILSKYVIHLCSTCREKDV